jgi:Prolipoprotein diacylglyceryl transferase
VLGFVGYGTAIVMAIGLAQVWQLTLIDRLIAMLVPPLAFLVVVTVTRAVVGSERIVFYQTGTAAVVAVTLIALVSGAHVARLVDLTVLGIGVFLVFGRLGCFAVGCCHGRIAKHGVTYGAHHVALGFWPRLSGRTLLPIQLFEAGVSLVLVVGALALSARPGRAAIVYIDAYVTFRFVIELLRGDPARPVGLGLSEAQWFSLVIGIVVAIAWPAWPTMLVGSALVVGAFGIAATRQRRELVSPLHLFALDQLCRGILATPNGDRRETRMGVGISRHTLDDGRDDWVLSSTHPAWSITTARAIATTLWPDADVIAGTLPQVMHVLVVQSQRSDAKK